MQFITAPMLRMLAEVAESQHQGLSLDAARGSYRQTPAEFDVQAANHLRSLEGRAKEGRD